MKYILIILLFIFNVAQGQTIEYSVKTVNGTGANAAGDIVVSSGFSVGDSLVRAFDSLAISVKYRDTSTMLNAYRTGMATNTANIALKKNLSDSAGNAGFTTLFQYNKGRDSVQANVNTKGRVDSIRLANTGILHTPTAAFSLSGNTGVITQTLATQAARRVFSTLGASATPTWNSLDSNYWAGAWATQVQSAVNVNLTAKQDTGTTWLKTGNNNINAGNFIGSTNNSSLRFRTNNVERLVVDSVNGISVDGIYIGRGGSRVNNNTAVGVSALAANTTGATNNAIGFQSLRVNTEGNWNNSIGASTLASNTTGSDNTAIGHQALNANVTGSNNTGIGANALVLTIGSGNVGIGNRSGKYNTTGSNQIFINSIDRTNYTGDQNNSPIYIQQNATLSSQNITMNGNVGINASSPATCAVLDIPTTTKGFLPPRMNNTQKTAIASPVAGLTIYCTDCTATDASTGVMQTYNGTSWKNNW